MAGVDKTYLTSYAEYLEVKEFFTPDIIKRSFDELKLDGIYIPEYTEEDFKDGNEQVLWNTSSLLDLWIAKNVKIDFIQERLKYQYSDNWIGWIDELDFTVKGYLYDIADYGNELVFYKLPDKDYIYDKDVYENATKYTEFIAYGTTQIFKYLDTLLNICRGLSNVKGAEEILMNFSLFGLLIEFKDGTYYYNGNEVDIGYYSDNTTILHDDGSIELVDTLKTFINIPQIKLSFNLDDINDYTDEQIIISAENIVFNASLQKIFNREHFYGYINRTLPKYLTKIIN